MKGNEQYIPELRKEFIEGSIELQDLPSKQSKMQKPQPLPQLQNQNQHQHQLQELPQQQHLDQHVHQQYQFHQPMQTQSQSQQQYHMHLPPQQPTHIPPPPQQPTHMQQAQVSPQLQSQPQPQIQQQLPQNQPPQPLSIGIQNHQIQQQIYPDITTMINNNPDIIPPSVQSTFVDPKICQVCGKRSNDMLRHMRIHDTNPRFSCKFPSSWCNYKSINYKRRYEFKRHLLCKHFKFDVIKMGRKMTVSSVLDQKGRCPCGLQSTARVWLDEHILPGDNIPSPCPLFKF